MLVGFWAFWKPTILSRYPCPLTEAAGLLWLTTSQKPSHPEDHCIGKHKQTWTHTEHTIHSETTTHITHAEKRFRVGTATYQLTQQRKVFSPWRLYSLRWSDNRQHRMKANQPALSLLSRGWILEGIYESIFSISGEMYYINAVGCFFVRQIQFLSDIVRYTCQKENCFAQSMSRLSNVLQSWTGSVSVS